MPRKADYAGYARGCLSKKPAMFAGYQPSVCEARKFLSFSLLSFITPTLTYTFYLYLSLYRFIINKSIYLGIGSGVLVLDLRIVHDRFGSSSDPTLNGNLHYPNDIDRSINEAAAD